MDYSTRDQIEFDHVREAARKAIESHDALLSAWRRYDALHAELPSAEGDIHLLEDLVYRKIYPSNAFEILARVDCDLAIAALLRRYLGRGVDYDRGFGGFIFEMGTMLSDLGTTQK